VWARIHFYTILFFERKIKEGNLIFPAPLLARILRLVAVVWFYWCSEQRSISTKLVYFSIYLLCVGKPFEAVLLSPAHFLYSTVAAFDCSFSLFDYAVPDPARYYHHGGSSAEKEATQCCCCSSERSAPDDHGARTDGGPSQWRDSTDCLLSE